MSLSPPFNTIDPYTGETFAEYATRVGMSWASIQKGMDYIERKKAQGHDFRRGVTRAQSPPEAEPS